MINRCNTCKVFSTKPYGSTTTAAMPSFQAEEGWPFETTGVDFTGPLDYKVTKKERGKCYVLIFTCATSRAVHLEVMKSDSGGVSEKAELVHCQEDLTSSHHFRQHLGIQGYCKLDKENTEEREATRPSCKRRHQMAIQPFQIPMVGWNV